MVLTKPKSETSSESSVLLSKSFSTPGGSTAARPRPSAARATAAMVSNSRLTVELKDGRVIAVRLDRFRRLIGATEKQRKNYELLGGGRLIHWPDVDADISVQGLLRG